MFSFCFTSRPDFLVFLFLKKMLKSVTHREVMVQEESVTNILSLRETADVSLRVGRSLVNLFKTLGNARKAFILPKTMESWRRPSQWLVYPSPFFYECN